MSKSRWVLFKLKRYSPSFHDANLKVFPTYYRAARFLYGLAYENYRSRKLFFGIPLIRQTSKAIGAKGEYRKGDSRITGAKIVPPPGFYVNDWMAFFEEHVNQGFSREGFFNFLAKQHVLFEAIHPFNDGNGRTGRIILNYFLISAGYPPVILKGDEENRKKYYRALEQGDSVLRRLTEIPFSRQDVRNALEDMNALLLEDLISESLRGNLDRILIRLLEEAVKRGKEWFTHETLLLKQSKSDSKARRCWPSKKQLFRTFTFNLAMLMHRFSSSKFFNPCFLKGSSIEV